MIKIYKIDNIKILNKKKKYYIVKKYKWVKSNSQKKREKKYIKDRKLKEDK